MKNNVEAVPKVNVVILSEAKDLLFFFSNQKIKTEDPSD
jgi:hypothetical protein